MTYSLTAWSWSISGPSAQPLTKSLIASRISAAALNRSGKPFSSCSPFAGDYSLNAQKGKVSEKIVNPSILAEKHEGVIPLQRFFCRSMAGLRSSVFSSIWRDLHLAQLRNASWPNRRVASPRRERLATPLNVNSRADPKSVMLSVNSRADPKSVNKITSSEPPAT